MRPAHSFSIHKGRWHACVGEGEPLFHSLSPKYHEWQYICSLEPCKALGAAECGPPHEHDWLRHLSSWEEYLVTLLFETFSLYLCPELPTHPSRHPAVLPHLLGFIYKRAVPWEGDTASSCPLSLSATEFLPHPIFPNPLSRG